MIKKRSYLLPKIISLFIVLFLFSVKVQAISNISINLKTPIHEGAINDKELKIDGEIESISKLKLVYVYINDENIGQAKVDEFEFKENTYKTKLEYSKDISYLKDGLYNLKILAIDEKDNREEKEFNVKIEKNEEQLENDKNTAQRYLEKSTANINNTEKVLNSVSSVSNVATISSLEVSLNGSVVTNGKLEQGKSYTIKGSGSSANGVLYQFWIKDPYTQVWQMIRDYGTGNSMNWTPTRTGKYLVGIHVKDKYSKEKLDDHKYIEYNVTAYNKKTIVIDAGHGGYDSGAVGPTGIKEKDVTLKVALKLGKILESNGVRVIYTRTTDSVTWPSNETQDLAARVAIANSNNIDLYVSIHTNSFNGSAHGTETYYYNGSAKGKEAAEKVQNELINSIGLYDRGVKTAGYYVLKNTISPSILVELGFIDNRNEEVLLNSDWFQQKCAEAIAKGILGTSFI